MPTLPDPLPTHSHQARDMAESFGTDPERYDRSRPRYPDALINALVTTAQRPDAPTAGPRPQFLDVGIGTGIVARALRAAGCDVVGVDADDRMAAFARRSGLPVDVARFEDWDARGRTFDAVVAGQTWHWVDPVAGAVKAAKVLRPGGLLAVFWNAGDPPAELAQAFANVYWEIDPDSMLARLPSRPAGQAYGGLIDQAADGIQRSGAFADPATHLYTWDQVYTRDGWLEQVPTSGVASQLPPDILARVIAGLGEAIDAVGGSFPVRYTTVALTALCLASAGAAA